VFCLPRSAGGSLFVCYLIVIKMSVLSVDNRMTVGVLFDLSDRHREAR